MLQWCSVLYMEYPREGYWYKGSLFRIFLRSLSQIPNFMRALQVHGKARPQVSFVRAFCSWPTNSVYKSYLSHSALGLSLKDQPQSTCQFNFDLNPVCKTCSWNPFEVTKNDLKNCVLEIAALLQSQGEVGSALLGQSPPFRILCACNLHFFGLSLCWNHLHCFLPCFSLSGNFTKVLSLSDKMQCPGIVEIN